MSIPDLYDGDDTVTQTTVSASAAPPPVTNAARSVFDWRGKGDAADASAPNALSPQPEEEKPTMAKKRAARTRRSSNGSPQLQICSVLLQNGPMSREALGAWGEEAGLTSAQISSALNNAKSHKRVTCDGGSYDLTKAGKEWVQAAGGEAAIDTPAASARKTAHRRGRAKRQEVDTSTPDDDPVDPTFRCAVMSDGCFFITKDGNTIELEPEEHKQMLHYLERMAETDRA